MNTCTFPPFPLIQWYFPTFVSVERQYPKTILDKHTTKSLNENVINYIDSGLAVTHQRFGLHFKNIQHMQMLES